MKMKEGYCRVAYYHTDTGEWSGRGYEGPELDRDANAPAGTVAMPFDDKHPQTQKLVDGVLVDYVPPAPEPAADYEWNVEIGEWVLTAAARQIKIDDTLARANIEIQEVAQARALREWALSEGKDKAALDKLKAIDDSIAWSRTKLKNVGS